MSVFYDSDEYEDFDSPTNSEIEENEEDSTWDRDWEDDEEFYSQVDHDSHVSNMMKHGTQKLTYPFKGFTKEPAAAPATSSSITPTTFLAPFDPALPSTSGTSSQHSNKVQPSSAANMAPFDPALPSTSGTSYQHSNKVQPLSAVNMAPSDPALPATSGTSYQHSNKVQPSSAVNMAPFDPALPSTSGTSSQYKDKVQPSSAVNKAPFDPALPSTSGTSYQHTNKVQPLSAVNMAPIDPAAPSTPGKITPERSSNETSKKEFSSGLEQIQPTKPTNDSKLAAPQSFEGSGQTQKRQYHSIAETQQECNDIVQVEKKPRVEELQNNATCEITESTNAIGGNDAGFIVIVQEDLTADEEDQKSEDGGNEGDLIGAEDSAAKNVVNSDETREDKNGSPQIAAAVTENPGTEKASGNTDENSGKTEASDAGTKLSQDLNSSEATAKTLQKSKSADVESNVDNEDEDEDEEDDFDFYIEREEEEQKYLEDIERIKSDYPKEITVNDENEWNEKFGLMKSEVETNAFTLGEEFKRGGVGRIYSGQYNGIKVAIKAIMVNPEESHIVKKEEAVMSVFDHINVLPLINSFHTHHFTLLILPYADRSLFDLVKKEDLDETRAKEIFRKIVDGIAYVHSLGYGHNDIKLENVVMFGENPRVCDFGEVWDLADGLCTDYDAGTLEYEAPEVVLEDPFDVVKSDVYSLGVLLHVMIAKDFPFCDTPATLTEPFRSIEENIKSGRRNPISTNIISKTASQLIDLMLTLAPEDRPSLEEVKKHPWFSSSI